MRAVVNMGSEVTLISYSAMNNLHNSFNKHTVIQKLTAVTGTPLRVLGAT